MTSFNIKCVALITMFMQHITYTYYPTTELGGALHSLLGLSGNIAFPLYVFLIAEGSRHTRSKSKFLLRLGVFALLSQIPYNMLFYETVASRNLNIFFCHFLGVLAIYVYEYVGMKSGKKWIARILPALLIIITAILPMHIDGGGFIGVAMIFFTYLATTRKWQMLVIGLGCVFLDMVNSSTLLSVLLRFQIERIEFLLSLNPSAIQATLFSLLSLIPVALHNGKCGRPLKWAFYWSYPLHLALLANVAVLLHPAL